MYSDYEMHIPGLCNIQHMPKVAHKVNLPGTQEHFNVPTYFCKKIKNALQAKRSKEICIFVHWCSTG